MLATQIAMEINDRWHELELLTPLDRLHKLESLVERHVLATSPCASASSYITNFGDTSDFVSRGLHEDSVKPK